MALLRHGVQELIPAGARMAPGDYTELRGLLLAAGAAEHDANAIADWVDNYNRNAEQYLNFRRTAAETQAGGARSRLFLCVHTAGRNCAVNYRVVEPGFLAEPFLISKPLPVDARDRKRPSGLRRHGIAAGLHFLVIRPPKTAPRLSDAERLKKLAPFLESLALNTQYAADAELFSEWVLANYRLIENGDFRKVSPLFLRHTRERGGKLILDLGFMALFFESRAYAAKDFAQLFNLAGGQTGALDRLYAVLAQTRAYGYGRVEGDAENAFLRSGGDIHYLLDPEVEAEGLVPYGARLGAEMEATIRAAGLK